MLQSLVHAGILKGVRGPRGGYELARENCSVTAQDILRVANVHEAGAKPNSEIVAKVVMPILPVAEREFGRTLSRITLDDMVQRAVVDRKGKQKRRTTLRAIRA